MPVFRLKIALLFFLTIFILASCGIEDYAYLFPVPQSNITTVLTTRASVRTTNNNSGTSFEYFTVFYKIYLSEVSTDDPMANLSSINNYLYSDINSIRIYIDNDNYGGTNMGTLFQGKGFKKLNLESVEIDKVLTSSVFNRYLVFDFTTQKLPTLEIYELNMDPLTVKSYTLLRSNDGFRPVPADRYFLSSADLNDRANIDENTNTDVVIPQSSTESNFEFAYAAMYIVSVGFNLQNYNYIYSTPSLINIFRLPIF